MALNQPHLFEVLTVVNIELWFAEMWCCAVCYRSAIVSKEFSPRLLKWRIFGVSRHLAGKTYWYQPNTKFISDLKIEAAVFYLWQYTPSHLRRTSSMSILTRYSLLTHFSQKKIGKIFISESIGINTQKFVWTAAVRSK